MEVVDITDPSRDKATVNITLKLPYQNERQPTFLMYVAYKSLEWSDTFINNQLPTNLQHTPETLSRIDSKNNILMDCQYTEMPQKTGLDVSVSTDLHYNTLYEFMGAACFDQLSCEETSNVSITFRTPEHAPTCPPAAISLIKTSSRSLKVTFGSLDRFCLHGPLVSYDLLLFETDKYWATSQPTNQSAEELTSKADKKISITDPDVTEGEFFNLHEYWNYTLITFAVNSVGPGAISQPISEVTEEDSKFCLHFYLHSGRQKTFDT